MVDDGKGQTLIYFDMKYVLTASIVALMAFPVSAQQEPEKTVKSVTHMSVNLEDCRRLVKYQAPPDVNYKPGVDVRGKAVTPADLPTFGAISAPDEIVIDFGLDLAGRYGFGAATLFDATAGIATIEYDLESGALTFNGKPLLNEDERAVEAACKMLLKAKKP